MKYVTLAGLIVLFILFVFSIIHYITADKTGQETLGEFWNRLTGLTFFHKSNSTADNLAVTFASFVLGVSLVYMLLRVVNGMIFTERIA